MQRVVSPQKRYRMLTAMYRVHQKIEEQKSRDKTHPLIGDRPGRQGDAEGGLELRPKGVRRREGEAGEDRLRSQMPRLPNRRRSAGNSRRRRGRQNSQKAQAKRLPRITMRARRTSSRSYYAIVLSSASGPELTSEDRHLWMPKEAVRRGISRRWSRLRNMRRRRNEGRSVTVPPGRLAHSAKEEVTPVGGGDPSGPAVGATPIAIR